MLDTVDFRELARQAQAAQAKLSTSSMFFEGSDALRLRSFGSVASVALALEGRLLTVEGDLVSISERHVPTSDRTVATTLHNLGPGFLLNASIRASAGAPRIGQVFAVLEVVRGLTGAVSPLAVLIEGYVTDTQRLGWPGATLRGSSEGPGVIRSITGTDPAAGVDIAEVVPTNARWRLLSLLASLVTDGTAANREASFVLDDGANIYTRVPSGVAQIASLTRGYCAAPRLERFTLAQDNTFNLPIPDCHLEDGHRIRLVTTNLQAGDNWGAPQLLVEEWIED